MRSAACSSRTSLLGWSYAAAILISALLVFQVQLLISKSILPWFGGTPAVWTTCMLFFQVVLFAGYAYAHASIARLRPAAQGAIHLLLIALAIIWLPVKPSTAWKPTDAAGPVLHILGLLATCVGMPFFVLSATGPLLQAWFARTHQSQSPYRLYALSNIGSLLGLVSYPFLIEPELPLTSQSAFWSLGFTVFALFCGYCALQIWQRSSVELLGESGPLLDSADAIAQTEATRPADVPPTMSGRLTWLGLAACASVMLLATTNHVCQDVAVMPFLWVLPLTLYLLTFIVCFEKEAWYSRLWCGVAAAALLIAASGLFLTSNGENLFVELFVCMAALFFVCMVCHGELIRRKPSPRHLTEFYLMSSAGGAVGGVFVALIAPQVFSTNLEFTLGMLVCYVLAVAVVANETAGTWFVGRRRLAMLTVATALIGALPLLRCQTVSSGGSSRVTARSFYGVLHVDDVDADDPERHGTVLRYGRILHGYQFVNAARRREPTLYYDRHSGIGLAISQHPRRAAGLRIGLVGLGVGTLAAYGQQGDYLRFYEINPDVLKAAREEFTFLSDCPATTEVILGDARLSMERESPQQFDVLALDAFSGDAIPTHLLTREAMEVYCRHLKPDGTLVVHITNRHVDLSPVLRTLAEHFGLQMIEIETKTRLDEGITASTWAILTDDRALLVQPAIQAARTPTAREFARIELWTDDYSNIFQIMR